MNDVAVVGCGPAGIGAALQLTREGFAPIVFEAGRPGGLLRGADHVENYPGFPAGVSGPELAERFVEQLTRWGVKPRRERVAELTPASGSFNLRTARGAETFRRVILATGTRPRPWPLTLPGETESRVHDEIIPLLELRGTRIAVVGAGDAAFDYALNLARRNAVVILNRAERPRCLPLLHKRAADHQRIEYRPSTRVAAVEPGSRGDVKLRCAEPAGSVELTVDYILTAIGRTPRLELFTPELRRSDGRPLPGLRLVGDAVNGQLRQTAVACGDGLRAAVDVARELRGELEEPR